MRENDYRERERAHDIERLRALRPIDDDFARAMLRDSPALAQEVLRVITGRPNLKLARAETQRDVRRLAGARSVCLDFYGEDAQGGSYNLELQRAARGAGARRARYHGSAMDVEALGAGADFGELPEAYIIFVCEDDPFGKGTGAYRFERTDAATGALLDDGLHVVYVNGVYRADDEIGRLMHDFSCSDPADMLMPALAERARYLKEDPEGVSQMCEMLEEMRDEAMELGRMEGMISAFAGMVRDGLLPLATAAERAGMTPEQFTARAQEAGLLPA